ncbi:efflux transporter periplasmic adaptor subunit [Oceanisphaera profunda]|uniref:Efflux transporter periplasmic adaptor subunit n=1 Tax=Oceanisphaera profunda TaxID=1416627 RepID=A0A1Y0D9H8_9GAMM|nr:efflux RND transporter periplasmic adaptor subunit [Oceanisphaera profunda]ART83847.1 efflux transporter periplasmic adaptor subunit [Oceanisphaera profunda]
MKLPHVTRRIFTLIAVIFLLLVLFIYVAFRSGPLAPVAVTISTVQSQAITPTLSGIGTVQARYRYHIGPTHPGRIKNLEVQVGDTVLAGQLLGEMDPVDLDAQLLAKQAAIKSAQASFQQAQAEQTFAQQQLNRYQKLLTQRGTSEENTALKRLELAVATAKLSATREEITRLRADLAALTAQHVNLRLIAPTAGLVVARNLEPGTTVMAGQAVIEIIDPTSLWVNTRFDQVNAEGLAPDLSAQLNLRSRRHQNLPGQVLRIEPLADEVTEEILAKIIFDEVLAPLPPLGELAEVTLKLDEVSAAPTILNAAIRLVDGQRGVWKLIDDDLTFTPLIFGRSDLEGRVQVLKGLEEGDRIVLYSEKSLNKHSRLHIVEQLRSAAP